MAKGKKSFLLHIDSLDILDDLDNEQSGLLFKAIKAYQKGNQIELDGIVRIAFSPFKNQFIRDDEKYKTTCERRALAGSNGGKKKQANLANASKCNDNLAKVADNNNKTNNDNKSDSDKEDIKELPPKVDFSIFQMNEYQISEVKRIRTKNSKTKKGAKLTQRIVNALAKEFLEGQQIGFSLEEMLTEWETRSWLSFKADWMPTKKRGDIMKQSASEKWHKDLGL